jgi:voltage-dependent calcium channel T type alpha-1G
MINRNEGMKLVVNALFASVPSMTNVLVVSGLFILIFSAMGIDFFKGKFYSCHGYNFINKVDILNTFDCLNYGGDWTNSVQNFDNIF